MFLRNKTRYSVYTYGADVLKKPAQKIDAITDDIRKISEEMLHTMKLFDGIGLAGPQYGLDKRIIALGVPFSEEGAISPGEAALLPRMPMVIINPEIYGFGSAKCIEDEGCLSVPGIYAPVERPHFIQFRGMTVDGELIDCECGGLLARCLQHEIDHLDGILFVSRLTDDVFGSIESKLKRLKKSGRKKDFKKTISV